MGALTPTRAVTLLRKARHRTERRCLQTEPPPQTLGVSGRETVGKPSHPSPHPRPFNVNVLVSVPLRFGRHPFLSRPIEHHTLWSATSIDSCSDLLLAGDLADPSSKAARWIRYPASPYLNTPSEVIENSEGRTQAEEGHSKACVVTDQRQWPFWREKPCRITSGSQRAIWLLHPKQRQRRY